jgi:hypothetical protein
VGDAKPHQTHLIEQGVDLLEVQKILGHHSILTTVRYTHLTDHTQESARTCIDARFRRWRTKTGYLFNHKAFAKVFWPHWASWVCICLWVFEASGWWTVDRWAMGAQGACSTQQADAREACMGVSLLRWADAGCTQAFACRADDASTTQTTSGAHDVRVRNFTMFGAPNRCNGCARPEES